MTSPRGRVARFSVAAGALLPAASGLAIGLTFSPHGGPVLPFLAFAPLALALGHTARDADAPPLAPFLQGFTTAVVAHGIGLYWIVPSLSWRTGLAVPTYALVVILIGMVAGAASAAAVFLRTRKHWPLPLALATCWTGFEWLAARVPAVPYAWLNAGGSLAWHPALAAGSELFGARFLAFWTVAAGAVVASAAQLGGRWIGRCWRTDPTWRGSPLRVAGVSRSAGTLLLLCLPGAFGLLRHNALVGTETAARESVVRVAGVQTGRTAGELSRWLAPLREHVGEQSVVAAVFPERFLGLPGPALAEFAAALGIDVVAGALDAEVVPDFRDARDSPDARSSQDTLWYNAAVVQRPGEPLSQFYRKTRLVPGLEAAGAWPSHARSLPSRGYAVGGDPEPLNVGGGKAGVMICYDSAFEANARALVRAGADWLLVVSNDDWLDPALPFRTTWAYWQHATLGRLRALENRISLIQVGATGYTFAVSPTGGRTPLALEPGEEGVAVLTARHRHGATLFTRTGDVLGLACFAVFAAAVLGSARRR